ncbi:MULTISPECIES: hypothetical protein [unclassified Streptomyces]|uniref:hypothetical protein n=1 Tax=unclassified Streptomyces TaxID=2593676 RepID=UPI0035DA4615
MSPTPVAYPGQNVKAEDLNGLVQPHVQATVGSFVVPTGAALYTAVAFTGTLTGNHSGMWVPAQSTRLVAPSAGVYLVHGGATWPGALNTADARGEIRIGGGGVAPGTRVSTQRGSSGGMQSVATGTVALPAGGYIEIFFNTQSGSNITISATLGITRISAT